MVVRELCCFYVAFEISLLGYFSVDCIADQASQIFQGTKVKDMKNKNGRGFAEFHKSESRDSGKYWCREQRKVHTSRKKQKRKITKMITMTPRDLEKNFEDSAPSSSFINTPMNGNSNNQKKQSDSFNFSPLLNGSSSSFTSQRIAIDLHDWKRRASQRFQSAKRIVINQNQNDSSFSSSTTLTSTLSSSSTSIASSQNPYLKLYMFLFNTVLAVGWNLILLNIVFKFMRESIIFVRYVLHSHATTNFGMASVLTAGIGALSKGVFFNLFHEMKTFILILEGKWWISHNSAFLLF